MASRTTHDVGLVIFDCDGVLVDSERLTVVVEARILTELFDGRIYSASEVERGKPWPDLFLHAARTMDVDSSQCAVIEDSINGARAAIAAGMTCYGFAGGLGPRDELEASGAIVFDTLSELCDVLLPVG